MSLFELLLFFGLFLLGIILLCFAFRYLLSFFRKEKTGIQKNTIQQKGKNQCPICNTTLFQGERIFSRVYKTNSTTEQSCTIHGCPHCYPEIEEGLTRICPVCHKKIPINGHLRAIIFTRSSEKKHVHVTGCTECYKKSFIR